MTPPAPVPIPPPLAPKPSTEVNVGDVSFDLITAISLIKENQWLVVIAAVVAFMFWVFQKDGFATRYLDYRIRKKELDLKHIDVQKKLANKRKGS